MRGQQQLEAMRMNGFAPSVVFIDTEPGTSLADDWHTLNPHIAHLQIGPLEKPDFRCVVGLTVCIFGDDAKRVKAIRDGCIEAKASRVITSSAEPYELPGVPSGRICHRTSEVTDTEGHLTWRI